jgi:hypothetical protein
MLMGNTYAALFFQVEVGAVRAAAGARAILQVRLQLRNTDKHYLLILN